MFRFPLKNVHSILKNAQVKKYQTNSEKSLPAQADVVIIGKFQRNKNSNNFIFNQFIYLFKRWRSGRMLYTLSFGQAWHSSCSIGTISTHIRNNMVSLLFFIFQVEHKISLFVSPCKYQFQAYKWFNVENTSK